ncbi:hypothetical protein ACOME3_010027 [Neoechinorhynchus agilis]
MPSDNPITFNVMVSEDVCNLLREYCSVLTDERRSDQTYERFVATWNRLGYSSLFVVRKFATTAYRIFLVDAFYVLREHMYRKFPYMWRIGAMYILYGLFMFEQRFPKVKMKVMLADWDEIEDLYDSMIAQKDAQAQFIFNELLRNSAFEFSGHIVMYSQNEILRTAGNVTVCTVGGEINKPKSVTEDEGVKCSEMWDEIRTQSVAYLQHKQEVISRAHELRNKSALSIVKDPFELDVATYLILIEPRVHKRKPPTTPKGPSALPDD